MRLLGLDFGTKTGWASGERAGFPASGTWVLATSKQLQMAKKLRLDRRADIRVMALLLCLEKEFLARPFQWLVYEDVLFQSSRAQTQLWASFRGAVWAFCHRFDVQPECLNTSSLKKFATGNGHADKTDMARALCKAEPPVYTLGAHGGVLDGRTGEILDDNCVDATHLLRWGLQHLRR